MAERNLLTELKIENARLIALLEANGIDWRAPVPAPPVISVSPVNPVAESELHTMSIRQKLALFSRLFRGRSDVFPVRWEGKSSGKTGYAPACANEWVSGVCEKPRIKCADCGNRELTPLSESVLFEHLAGKRTIGVYPLLTDDTCNFLALDFDEADWKEDALALRQSCHELGVPVAMEVSRSGNGPYPDQWG